MRVVLPEINCLAAFLMSTRPSTSNLNSSLWSVFILYPSYAHTHTHIRTKDYLSADAALFRFGRQELPVRPSGWSTEWTLELSVVYPLQCDDSLQGHSQRWNQNEPIVMVSDYMSHENKQFMSFWIRVLKCWRRVITRYFRVMVQSNISNRRSCSLQWPWWMGILFGTSVQRPMAKKLIWEEPWRVECERRPTLEESIFKCCNRGLHRNQRFPAQKEKMKLPNLI